MAQITITELLSNIATTVKRLTKKREYVMSHLTRSSRFVDPLERQGGSQKAVESEMQSIYDLLENVVTARRAIRQQNEVTMVTIEGITRSVADWLVWRREVSGVLSDLYASMEYAIRNTRQQESKKVTSNEVNGASDIVVHLDEADLHQKVEMLETILASIDGRLSLVNARTFVENSDVV